MSIAKWPLNLIIDMVNAAISGINTMIKTINKVPGVSIPTIGKIPKLAKGGIVDAPTIAMVGEAGRKNLRSIEEIQYKKYSVNSWEPKFKKVA